MRHGMEEPHRNKRAHVLFVPRQQGQDRTGGRSASAHTTTQEIGGGGAAVGWLSIQYVP